MAFIKLLSFKEELGITAMAGPGAVAEPADMSAEILQTLDDLRHGISSALIIGRSLLDRLDKSGSASRKAFLRVLDNREISRIALSRTFTIPDYLLRYAHRRSVSIFSSRYDEFLLQSRLTAIIRKELMGISREHGVLVNIDGIGILLTGESGAGKTTCGLAIAGQGYRMVADDLVEMRRDNSGALCGKAPAEIEGLAEIKGVGIVAVGGLGGESRIHAVVELTDDFAPGECYSTGYREILGEKLPCYVLTDRSDAEGAIINLAGSLSSMGGLRNV
ncbi:MAG: hypothetical protein PHY31_02735 [Smithellaceae bacterium]|nr:hypothetical protein [Smithellaceae bacterium]